MSDCESASRVQAGGEDGLTEDAVIGRRTVPCGRAASGGAARRPRPADRDGGADPRFLSTRFDLDGRRRELDLAGGACVMLKSSGK